MVSVTPWRIVCVGFDFLRVDVRPRFGEVSQPRRGGSFRLLADVVLAVNSETGLTLHATV